MRGQIVRRPQRLRFAPDAWCSKPLGQVPTDPDSAATTTEIVQQRDRVSPTYNIEAWGAAVFEAGPTYRPVYSTPGRGGVGTSWAFENDGVPYPDDLVLQPDNDCAVLIVNRARTAMWELYGCDWQRPNGTLHKGARERGDVLKCRSAGRMLDTTASPGHYVNRGYRLADDTFPFSYEDRMMGITAAGIPIEPTMILRSELESGVPSGPLGVAVLSGVQATSADLRYPAQRYDSGHTLLTPYGARLQLDPTITPTGSRMERMAILKAQAYGLIVIDRSGCLSFRAEPGTREFLDGVPGYVAAKRFPWDRLRLLST